MAHDTPTIAAQPRERTGTRYARRLRQQGLLPAVIYGHKRDPLSVTVEKKEVLTHLEHGTHVLEIKVEGGPSETCLVKDLQFGYLGDDVIHVDFSRVNLDEEVDVRVQLRYVGQPAAAQPAGAILTHDLTDLPVACRVNAIPEEIKVDLMTMETRTVLTVAELVLPPGVRATLAPDTPVAHVSYVHAEEAVGEEVEVETGPGEPEVITEAKPQDKEDGAETSS